MSEPLFDIDFLLSLIDADAGIELPEDVDSLEDFDIWLESDD